MQFAEFGTQVSLAKSLWNTAMGMTGLGQGEHSAGNAQIYSKFHQLFGSPPVVHSM